MLPKKKAICQQYRKCGKAKCKCNNGTLHGPYYFYFYRVEGKLKKSYIRKSDAQTLWESYSQRRDLQKQRAADRKEFAQLCRDLRHFNRLLAESSLMKALGGW
jgi:hypothetical protein